MVSPRDTAALNWAGEFVFEGFAKPEKTVFVQCWVTGLQEPVWAHPGIRCGCGSREIDLGPECSNCSSLNKGIGSTVSANCL
jgi:hypothetical protein